MFLINHNIWKNYDVQPRAGFTDTYPNLLGFMQDQ